MTKCVYVFRCPHQHEKRTYIQSFFYAMRRMARGERQVYCRKCQKWQWPDELCEYAEVE